MKTSDNMLEKIGNSNWKSYLRVHLSGENTINRIIDIIRTGEGIKEINSQQESKRVKIIDGIM